MKSGIACWLCTKIGSDGVSGGNDVGDWAPFVATRGGWWGIDKPRLNSSCDHHDGEQLSLSATARLISTSRHHLFTSPKN